MKQKILILIISFLLIPELIFSLTLDEAIKIALKNNFEIQYQKHIVNSSKIKLKSAEALKMPSFSVESSFTQLDDSKKVKFDTPIGSQSFKISEKNYFDITTGIKWNVYTGGLISENINVAKLDIESNKQSLLEKKLDIIYKTKIAYLNILILKSYEKIALKHFESLNSHLNDVKNFYNQGLVPYVDILQTQVKLKESEQLLTKIRNNIKVAKTNLAILLGYPPDKQFSVNNINFDIKKKIDLNKLYNLASKKRPILKKIDAEIGKLSHLIEATKSGYKPKLYLFGGYKWSDIDDDVNDKGNLFIQAGLKFNLDWDKTFQDVNSLKEKLISLKFTKKDLNSKILLQVKKSYEEYLTAIKNLDVSLSAVKTAEEYFRIIKLKYKEGLSDNTDVLDAEAMVTKAKMEEKSNYYNVIARIFAIERAVGGKYE